MPYDPISGTYADAIMDPTSIVSRMNAGRLYDSYFGAASRNARRILLEELGTSVDETPDIIIDKVYGSLLEFLSIIDTEQYEHYSYVSDVEDKRDILKDIEDNELYIYYKISSKKKSPEIVTDMEKTRFSVPREPILINGVPTKSGITIGNLYMILLNKVADNFLAAPSAGINHYGMPVRINASKKNTEPYICNPTKTVSETEARLLASYCLSPRLAAETKARAASIVDHTEIYKNILSSDTPTNMDYVIDRNVFKYGTDKPLMLLNDIYNSCGIEFNYERGQR